MNSSLSTRIALTGLLAAGLFGCSDQPQPRERNVAPPATASGSGTPAASPSGGTESAPAKAAVAEGWGTIKGTVKWTGPAVTPMPLTISKDVPYCVAKRSDAGKPPIVDQKMIVNPTSMAIEDAIVYMNVRKAPPIHPDYPQSKADVAKANEEKFKELNGIGYAELNSLNGNHEKLAALKAPVMLDQIFCQYVPHGIALREGEKVLALNYEEVAHNILVESLKANSSNQNMPNDSALVYDWTAEPNHIDLKCSIHGWMTGYAMVFDHPYFDVTDGMGTFELKNVPAGEIDLVVRNPEFLVGGRTSPYKLTVNPDETVELEITFDGTKGAVAKK